MPDVLEHIMERTGKALRASTIALQKVIGHALRRPGTDARQTAQGLDQLIEAVWRFQSMEAISIRKLLDPLRSCRARTGSKIKMGASFPVEGSIPT